MIDQMAKAAYEAAAARSWAHDEIPVQNRMHWEQLPEHTRDCWRDAVRAALAAVPPDAAASLSYFSKPEPDAVREL